MNVYVVTLYVNYGWGMRFDNVDVPVKTRVFIDEHHARSCGKAHVKTRKNHPSYKVITLELEECYHASSSS